MGFDNPWTVYGAKISPEVARLLAFASTNGAHGVVSPTDFKVTAQAVPNASVLVSSGASLTLNRSVDGGQQTYVLRNPAAETVPTTANGAGSARSDLVIARVEDPQYGTWQAPANPELGPYAFHRIIQGVPAATRSVDELNLGYSAETLARIDWPASTGTVTAGMITDLRRLARPREHREVLPVVPSSGQALASEVFVQWPASARPSVEVPEWATHWQVLVHLTGMIHLGGGAEGLLVATIGNTQIRDETAQVVFDYDAPPSGGERRNLLVAGGSTLKPGLRGKTMTLGLDARRTGVANGNNGYLQTAGGAIVTFDAQFSERLA